MHRSAAFCVSTVPIGKIEPLSMLFLNFFDSLASATRDGCGINAPSGLWQMNSPQIPLIASQSPVKIEAL
jgi:hypothetical protein